MKVLVTGAAGFIGFHLAKRLAGENHFVTCIDNINNYYDVDLKYGRLTALGFERNRLDSEDMVSSKIYPELSFAKMDLCESERLNSLFVNNSYDIVFHLAAQAGVRYSITNPNAYISANVQGFLNMLEAARLFSPRHFVYASSSSVYGLNTRTPFSEKDITVKPASLYAATKLANEHMAYTYSHLYHISTTGLRFFTVYGPWGRPDMAPFIFTKSIIEEKPINLFNNGNMKRDFTFIDDIVEGLLSVMNLIPVRNPKDIASDKGVFVPAAIYNIGNGSPIELMDFVHTLEDILGKKAILQFAPMQAGDVIETWADCSSLERDTGFRPQTSLSTGIKTFVDWYKDYYR